MLVYQFDGRRRMGMARIILAIALKAFGFSGTPQIILLKWGLPPRVIAYAAMVFSLTMGKTEGPHCRR